MTRAAAQSCPADIPGQILWLSERYFRTERDQQFLDALAEVMMTDGSGAILPTSMRNPLNNEARGLAVIGESGSGKSVMLRRNLQRLPGWQSYATGEGGNYLTITLPPEATIRSLAIELLSLTGYGNINGRAKVYELWDVVRHKLQKEAIGLLWIDEAHHLFRSGPGRDPAAARRMMKNLLQTSGVAVVLSGVSQLNTDLKSDPETDRRFLRMHLRHYTAEAEQERLGQFVLACLQQLGLAADDEHLAQRILHAEQGSLGRAIDLFKTSAIRALRNCEPVLTLAELRRSFELQHGASSGPSPFDERDWHKLRKVLRP